MNQPVRDSVDRRNNFDALRLVAALQVLYMHGSEHLRIGPDVLGKVANNVIDLFPGVPVFFVISGFLISASYARVPTIREYARNRLLRVYPALWVAFAASIFILLVFGQLTREFILSSSFAGWVVGQLTIIQFFNPAALRGFGVGVLNGSLWTIPVELQFYVLLPVLCACIRGRGERTATAMLLLLAALSFAVWFRVHDLWISHDITARLLQVSLLPHLYLFLLGVVMQRHFGVLRSALADHAGLWLCAYLGVVGASHFLGTDHTAAAAAARAMLLAVMVISLAYTFPAISHHMLRGNDVSYGVYVYHMLIVNVFVQLGWTDRVLHLLGAALITVGIAGLSWHVVERPALQRKTEVKPPEQSRGRFFARPLASGVAIKP